MITSYIRSPVPAVDHSAGSSLPEIEEAEQLSLGRIPGALFAGSPAEIVDKILWEHELLGHTRFLAQVGLGGLSQRDTLASIDLLATEILPAVRAALGERDLSTPR